MVEADPKSGAAQIDTTGTAGEPFTDIIDGKSKQIKTPIDRSRSIT